MLKTLTLHNFRSHRDTTIEFTNGLNVIIGENGAGKSSIFQAIGIGLFNSVHNLKELIRYGETTATVDITFAFAGVTYRSYREFGKTSSWRLFRSDEVMADGPEAVTKEIAKLFETVDLSVLFNEMIGVGQFNMVAPFMQSDTPRRVYFNRLLGTDEYLKVSDNLRAGEKYGECLLKEDESREIEFRTELKFYQHGLKELDSIILTLTELKENYEALLIIKNQFQEQLNEQEQLKREYIRYKELKQKLEFQAKQATIQVDAASKLVMLAKEELTEAKQAALVFPQLEQEQNEYVLQLEHYEKGQEVNLSIRTTTEILEQRFQSIQTNDTCPICGADIKHNRLGLLRDIDLELVGLKQNIVLNGQKPQLPENYEVTKLLANKVDKYQTKYDERMADLELRQKEQEEIATQIASLEAPEFDEHDLEVVQTEYIRVQTDIATTEVKIESCHRRIDEISRQRNPTKDLEAIQKEIETKQKSLETLKAIRGVYKQLGPIMARMLLEQINIEARELFNDLLGEHYQVDVTIGDEYEIEAVIDGNKVSFHNLSGGQQVLLALAIRLSLLKVLSGTQMMLIDEPFDSLDSLSQEAVVKALSELELEQLIVVTHNDAFDADNVIKFELVEGVSKCA